MAHDDDDDDSRRVVTRHIRDANSRAESHCSLPLKLRSNQCPTSAHVIKSPSNGTTLTLSQYSTVR